MANLQQIWRLVFSLLFVTILACTPTVYVEPANTISFQETLQIESVMDARLAAEGVVTRVRGDAPTAPGGYLEPMRLPEAFTSTGLEGTRAYEYQLRRSAVDSAVLRSFVPEQSAHRE